MTGTTKVAKPKICDL